MPTEKPENQDPGQASLPNEPLRIRRSPFLKIGKNSFESTLPGSGQQGGGGLRAACHGMSPKSAKKCKIRIVEWEPGPDWWQTLSHATEDLEGLGQKEIINKDLHDWHVMEQTLKRTFPKIEFIVVKELTRRSDNKGRTPGSAVGKWVPHRHIFFRLDGITKSNLSWIATEVIKHWLSSTNTQVYDKAFASQLFGGRKTKSGKGWRRKPSYEWINEGHRKMACYVSKYVTKSEEKRFEFETGRMWSAPHTLPQYQAFHMEVAWDVAKWVVRLMKRKWKGRMKNPKVRKRLFANMKDFRFWGLESRGTMGEIIAMARVLSGEVVAGCPF
jgi:hypothetical protein